MEVIKCVILTINMRQSVLGSDAIHLCVLRNWVLVHRCEKGKHGEPSFKVGDPTYENSAIVCDDPPSLRLRGMGGGFDFADPIVRGGAVARLA